MTKLFETKKKKICGTLIIFFENISDLDILKNTRTL